MTWSVKAGGSWMMGVLRAGVVAGGMAWVGVAGWAGAQTVTLPTGFGSIEGVSSNQVALGSSVGRYQAIFDASALSDLPAGAYITSMRLRLDNSALFAWPLVSRTITRYDVRLGRAARPASSPSGTFADNMVDALLVRSGSLALPAGVYPAGPASGPVPEAWGPVIRFPTVYRYGGGPLVLEVRTSGAGEGGASADTQTQAGVAGLGTVLGADEPVGFLGTGGVVVQFGYVVEDRAFQSGVTKMYVPEAFATVEGDSANAAVLPTGGRTVLAVAGERELDTLGKGSSIVGISFRNDEQASVFTATYSSWEARLSRSVNPPSLLDALIGANVGPDETVVRSGFFTLPGGALPSKVAGPVPAVFGSTIPFVQGYAYDGGPLLTVLRTSGAQTLAPAIDACSLTTPGYGSDFAARVAFSSTATSAGLELTYPVTRLSVDAAVRVPESQRTSGGVSNTSTLNSPPRAVQIVVSAAELSAIPRGSVLTGLSLRQVVTSQGAWPQSNVVFDRYAIDVSTSPNAPIDSTGQFADNEGPDKVRVREGPLVVAAGSYKNTPGSSVNPFGPTIVFQRPFVYRGGNLCVTIRHSGNGQSTSLSSELAADSSKIRLWVSTDENGTNASFTLPGPVTLFSYTPSVTLPRALENDDGESGYSLFDEPGTIQTVFGAGEMRHIPVGSLISGLSLRKSNGGGTAAWPPEDLPVGRFDITLSTSPRSPTGMSDSFAENIGSDAVQVRSGAITIPAGATVWRSTPGAGDHRWFIEFQRPFRYTGGPLSVTIRHTAQNSTFTTMDVDGDLMSDARTRWNVGLADATASNRSERGAIVMRLAFVPRSFCAADLNGDGFVDDVDFVEFTQAYDVFDCGASLGQVLPCPADFTFDGFVDDSDFVIFAAAYAEFSCPP